MNGEKSVILSAITDKHLGKKWWSRWWWMHPGHPGLRNPDTKVTVTGVYFVT